MENLKGAALIGQSGGPTAAINATLAGAISAMIENKRAEGDITAIYESSATGKSVDIIR